MAEALKSDQVEEAMIPVWIICYIIGGLVTHLCIASMFKEEGRNQDLYEFGSWVDAQSFIGCVGGFVWMIALFWGIITTWPIWIVAWMLKKLSQ